MVKIKAQPYGYYPKYIGQSDVIPSYKAISTSSLARYEYTSGDILYLSMPAKIINDLDFFLSDVNVICLVACAVAEFLTDWWIAASASIVSGKYTCKLRCRASCKSLNSSAFRVILATSPSRGMRSVDSIISSAISERPELVALMASLIRNSLTAASRSLPTARFVR